MNLKNKNLMNLIDKFHGIPTVKGCGIVNEYTADHMRDVVNRYRFLCKKYDGGILYDEFEDRFYLINQFEEWSRIEE